MSSLHILWTSGCLRLMVGSVNLLLLLSALLSALTGGTSAMRAPTPAHAVARAAAALRVEVRASPTASRPQQTLPRLPVLAAHPMGAAVIAIAAAQPLYASRRRE